MKRRATLAFLALLPACASVESTGEYAVPTCDTRAECRGKWNAAEIWINRYSGSQVESRTETRMATGMTGSYTNILSVVVEKRPLPDGGWRIEARMRCALRIGCEPDPWEATREFNRFVNRSWVAPSGRLQEPPARDDDAGIERDRRDAGDQSPER